MAGLLLVPNAIVALCPDRHSRESGNPWIVGRGAAADMDPRFRGDDD
jgi:hypothetical protein